MKKVFPLFLVLLFALSIFGQNKSSVGLKRKSEIQTTKDGIPKGWKLVDLDSFSFILPESMEDKKVRGIDSQVWRFEDDEMKLVIDSGRYKTVFPNADDFENSTKQVVVDNAKGQYFAIDYSKPKISQGEIDENDKQKPYLNAIVFKQDKYLFSSFYIQYKNQNEQEIAKKILYSIKFKQK